MRLPESVEDFQKHWKRRLGFQLQGPFHLSRWKGWSWPEQGLAPGLLALRLAGEVIDDPR